MPAEAPFWKTKSLDEMTDVEWESLCDGCGRCCLNKLEEWDTGRIFWTNVACQLLDAHTCRCSDYPNRHATVPDCIRLDPHEVRTLGWLPPSCAYRMIDEGRDLAWWHPLVSGDPETVHTAGVSVRGRFISELTVSIDDLEDHIDPFAGRKPKAGLAARRRLRPNRVEPA